MNVLTIMGYEDNKETFAHKFLETCENYALADVVSNSPEEQKRALREKLVSVPDSQKKNALVAENAITQEYKQALQHTIQKTFQEFITVVMKTLADRPAERDKLQTYLQSVA